MKRLLTKTKWLIILLALFCPEFDVQGQIIYTIAGNGTLGYSGDGGPATAAEIRGAEAIAVDASNNVYIADTYNGRIRKISSSGIITTIYSAPALPTIVATDNRGNVYLDSGDNVLKIDISGTIFTVAGNGSSIYSGDGGPATDAGFADIYALAIDIYGNIYICDATAERVRKVDTFGIVYTIAGNGTPGFSGDGGLATNAEIHGPQGVAVDNIGNVYIADFQNQRVRKVDTFGIISTIAGTGTPGYSGDGEPATAAELNYPYGIAVDSFGDVYISDNTNFRYRKIDTLGIITTIAGTGTPGDTGDGGAATAAEVYVPNGIAVNNKGIYLDDASAYIRMITIDHPPVFASGVMQRLTICENEDSVSIDSFLTVTDLDTGQKEFWNIAVAPAHGSLVAVDSAVSTGGAITPAGLFYSPVTGYSGNDSFDIRINDGVYADTTKIYVTIRSIAACNEGVPYVNYTSIKAYPNPASEELTITGLTGNTCYRLLSITGACLQQGIFEQGSNSLSVKNLVSGVYILELTGENGMRDMVRVVKD